MITTNTSIQSITKSFGSMTVLREISLSLDPEGITVLVGESGCGKTTLLRLLAGLEKPDAGQLPTFESVAMVFQEPRLFPWLTVEENVALAVRELPPEESKRRVGEMLAKVGLSTHAKQIPDQLSGGMAQRVAIARALIVRPELLLMDEPFSALDALTRDRVRREFVALHQANPVTTVIVTHDVLDAVLLGSNILKIHNGTMVQSWHCDLPYPRNFTNPTVAALADEILQSFYESSSGTSTSSVSLTKSINPITSTEENQCPS